MPSLYEGLPLALIEEQANGLICYVSDCITSEANVTGNVNFISIEKREKVWADTIINGLHNYNRAKNSDEAIRIICKKGYSIKHEAKKLKQLYQNNK